MLGQIKNIFHRESFEPSINVFPNLDSNRLIKQLKIAERGKQQGKKEMPSSDATSLDNVELEIVSEVQFHRQQCLQQYQEHCTAYTERLANASRARTKVEAVATKSPGEFRRDQKEFETTLQNDRDRLMQCASWRADFMRTHGLRRPCHSHDSSNMRWIAIAVLLVLLEGMLNSYLFAQKNDFGLIGGALAAVLVSIVNVGLASLFGYYSRFVNHRRFMSKLFGCALVAMCVAILGPFNFGVAHFRDGLVQDQSWEQAALNAVEILRGSSFLNVDSIESWLLIIIGSLISVGAFLKAYYSDDPYPGFGRVQRELEEARARYENNHRGILEDLEARRNEIVEDLQAADDEVQTNLNEAIDSLFGTVSLNKRLNDFLSHCNESAQHLLQIYRDKNEETRNTPVPAYFREPHTFAVAMPEETGEENRFVAMNESKRITDLITNAVAEINQEYKDAVSNFDSAKEIEDRSEQQAPKSEE